MANIIQQKRFTNELKMLSSEPLHYITSYPDDKDPLTWYFLIRGQTGTSFHGGDYIGKIIHSKKYPAEPPAYFMLTPSGRYEVNKEICLTNSRYHKGEWSSTWNIKTILIAFYSIFLDDTTTGISHIHKSDAERKVLAKGAIDYNKKFHNDIYTKFNFTHISDSAPVTKKEEIKLEAKEEIKVINEVKIVNQIVKEEIKQVDERVELVEIVELVENTNIDISLNNISTKIKDLNNKIEKQFEYIKSLEEELNI